MSRVNARIDDKTASQIDYLAQATGQTVSHVVRESVARYFAEVRSQDAGPRRLLSRVGKGDSGRSDIASDVKRHVGQALDERIAPPRPDTAK